MKKQETYFFLCCFIFNGILVLGQNNGSLKTNVHYFPIAMRDGETNATFSVSSGTTVEVLDENRSISIVDGKFNDGFTSFGVHLYKITK